MLGYVRCRSRANAELPTHHSLDSLVITLSLSTHRDTHCTRRTRTAIRPAPRPETGPESMRAHRFSTSCGVNAPCVDMLVKCTARCARARTRMMSNRHRCVCSKHGASECARVHHTRPRTQAIIMKDILCSMICQTPHTCTAAGLGWAGVQTRGLRGLRASACVRLFASARLLC